MAMTQVYCALICGFLIGFGNAFSAENITVISQITNDSVMVMNTIPAAYVSDTVYLQGRVVYANPANACSAVQPPPYTPETEAENFILLASIFDCTFQDKIKNAQDAGYTGIIVHNVGSNDTRPIFVTHPERLNISAFFVGEHHGILLRDKFNYTSGYFIRIKYNPWFIPVDVLFMMAVSFGVFFVIMVAVTGFCFPDHC